MDARTKWIKPEVDTGDIVPVFKKEWNTSNNIRKATIKISSLGIYHLKINGQTVSDYVLAPGWTVYKKRLQYQVYDITKLISSSNEINVYVGKGWYRSPMPGWNESEDKIARKNQSSGLIAEIHLEYKDGTHNCIRSDSSWLYAESQIRFSEIYDGEVYDANYVPTNWNNVIEFEHHTNILIPQEGEEIREHERFAPKAILKTPKGETIIDFGQIITGYVELNLIANKGDKIRILHGEVLDADGNFYNNNYRSAKAELTYICNEGPQTWKPLLTFWGFRYLKLEDYPIEPSAEQFTAIAVYSNIKQTGTIKSSDSNINQLFSNIIWGQKSNFLDVPTDCPQRDERLGWTGDAQVFIKAASYNYDVEKFFKKWLRDLAADQRDNGAIGQVIPDYLPEELPSAGWGDAAVICPWQIYQTYGTEEVLEEQFDSMKNWVDYITATTKNQYLWTGGVHFGDWLGLDAAEGSYKGSSRDDLIATAFYARSTEILVKAGNVIKRDVSQYQELYHKIVAKFQCVFDKYYTQTEYILAIWFGLAVDLQKQADLLAEKIVNDGVKMQTGFIGTPYLLHVLSTYGYTQLAYTLLLRKEYPSWMFPLSLGATTIWEHWDGINDKGEFWSADMNSFNHYAYGAVADWIYEQAAGIQPIEEYPGFEKVRISPQPDSRIESLEVSFKSRSGTIVSSWLFDNQYCKYTISTEVPAIIIIDKVEYHRQPGTYVFWSIKK